MSKHLASALLSGLALAASAPPGFAFAIGHHGGIILNCTAPLFFEESPARDAQVGVVDRIAFTASDNTDPETLKLWVNNQPVAFTVAPQPSGRLTVSATLPQPITSGRAWIKATGVSDDGCDQLHTWNVYAGH